MKFKPLVIEFEGEEWTARKLAPIAKRSVSWALRKLQKVEAGKLTMSELLDMAAKNEPVVRTNRRDFSFEYYEKTKGRGRPKKITVTTAEIMRRVGIEKDAAFKRLVRAKNGELSPKRLFYPPRGRSKQVIKDTALSDGRSKLQHDLELVGLGKLSYNEISRREAKGVYG